MAPNTTTACFLVATLMLAATTGCLSWQIRPGCHRKNGSPAARSRTTTTTDIQQRRNRKDSSSLSPSPEPGTSASNSITRRHLFAASLVAAAPLASVLLFPLPAPAKDGNGVVTVRLESPKDSLGVEIYDTNLRGKTVVAIRRVVVANKNNRGLAEGMILRPRQDGGSASYTSKEFVEKLGNGPYPLEIDFVNLAATGDAISDLGSSIVTPGDALELAQATEDSGSSASRQQQQQQQQQQEQKGAGYSITTIQQTNQGCAMQSRRNDVLEIEYEASYIEAGTGRKIVYDASAFRGTGNRPYQMVLGSGDVIPGVDQGLYDMCPGDRRLLRIPPVLGHGPKSRKLYRIPDIYENLEWEISLVTIDSTVREDNNVVSREERESRFAY